MYVWGAMGFWSHISISVPIVVWTSGNEFSKPGSWLTGCSARLAFLFLKVGEMNDCIT
jgi:hypothetical protein